MEKKIIITTEAPAPIGPYNQAVQSGNMLFISGQVAINPKNGNIESTDIFEDGKKDHHYTRSAGSHRTL
ncbi:MAG: Rid family hydrolase [Bacteroidota bacterium]|nr:Rid family hydrolase [Bacteroidota bacterium]